MKSKIAQLPRKILIERGAIERVEEIIDSLGERPLVVADSVTKNIAGEHIRKQINGEIIIIKDSTIEEVKRVEEQKTDCIISVGGGKVIDVGKLAAHNKNIPFVSFPTACAHDGIASENVSLTINGKYSSIQATAPFAC